MKTTGNTILITGGGSGIGLETARLFSALGNRVIITGRNADKLKMAATEIPGLITLVSDATNGDAMAELVKTMEIHYPGLNILMNNAGRAGFHSLRADKGGQARALEELEGNLLPAVGLTESLLPLLFRQPEAAVINNSSVVALAPAHRLPFYSAAKAALHAYTQSLRYSLMGTGVKVFELMPPLVDTDFAREIPGPKMTAAAVAEALLEGLQQDEYEICPGAAGQLYRAFRSSPGDAFRMMNRQEPVSQEMGNSG